MQDPRTGLGPTATERFLKHLVSWDGEIETSPNRSPHVDAMKTLLHGKTDTLPYCVDTIRYAARLVDDELGTKNILHPTRSARELWSKTPRIARLANPEPGCIVLWGYHDDSGQATWMGHAGAVVRLLPGGKMETVEGNTSPRKNIDREGDGIHLKVRTQFVRTGPMRTLGFLKVWVF